ncbi:unnamed protein product (macronuclear) [Paramecium tetraurelia]|uniref:RecA family profile 1 domain-containing protein n=1 Tax=Paramecium tetraurelia TaxID=5888 RepID=A0DFA4_PARTE|nr:uncharacterized protein GSPATT00016534001 [Paramecium tetraurelia]CAK81721.1 unnamed protein product [Paramecium tetraurelia]|eukprot:XP_001449118.1 hypothetical protein (macronuclear) [Paramecium tetraurelia strain d4-2]
MNLLQLIEIESKFEHLSIIPIFDEILKYTLSLISGGIQTGILTELYGEAGCGKTHVCMTLMINTIINYKTSRVIYISTAKQLQQDRFNQLLCKISYVIGNQNIAWFTNLFNKCIIQHLNNTKFMDEYIYEQLPTLLEQYQFKLIIIDNITTYLQELQLTLNQMQKTSILKKFSNHFRKLAKKHNIAVVFVNNVVSSTQNNKLYPALGIKWSEMIDERIQVEKKGMIRHFRIDISHRVALDDAAFTIQESGIYPQVD